MTSEGDQFVQQHMEAFNEQLAAMAYHHNRALALISAQRLQEDLQQPKPSDWRQHMRGASQWLKQRLVSPEPQEEEIEPPSEVEVVVIESTYTVIPSDGKPAAESTPEKEEAAWAN